MVGDFLALDHRFAARRDRLVIIEADLRKPSLAHLFNLPAGPGLAEYLSGAADLNDVMKFLPDHHLTVIPAGTSYVITEPKLESMNYLVEGVVGATS